MERTDRDVLAAIRMITGAKMMQRITPRKALQSEIAEHLGMTFDEVYDSCVRLYREGKIEGHNEDGVRWFRAVQLPEELEQMSRKL